MVESSEKAELGLFCYTLSRGHGAFNGHDDLKCFVCIGHICNFMFNLCVKLLSGTA